MDDIALARGPRTPEDALIEDYVLDLYRVVLGRSPDPEGFAHHCQALREGVSPMEIFRAFANAEERGRGAARAEPTASSSATLRVVFATHEHIAKVHDVVRGLLASADDSLSVLVLSSYEGKETPTPDLGPRVEVRYFPGDSVFHMRARLPELLPPGGFVALFEDHNLVGAEWSRIALASIRDGAEAKIAFAGPVINATSRGPWAWASFLHTFAAHWSPVQAAGVPPNAINVVFRRSLLGTEALPLCALESVVLPGIFQHVRYLPDLVVDHVQQRSFFGATGLHFHNGRVSGAVERARPDSLGAEVVPRARAVRVDRLAHLEALIDAHPRRDELPAGTKARMRWLAFAHACGMVVGWWSGLGRSPWALE